MHGCQWVWQIPFGPRLNKADTGGFYMENRKIALFASRFTEARVVASLPIGYVSSILC